MPLYLFLLVILSLSCGTVPPLGDAEDAWPVMTRSLVAAAGVVVGWSILTHVVARTIAGVVGDGDLTPELGARWVERAMNAFRWGGLAVAVFVLVGFPLAASIQSAPWTAQSMFLQALVLLSPATAMMLATFSAEHYYGVRLGYASARIGVYARMMGSGLRASTAWLIFPVLILLAAFDLFGVVSGTHRHAAWWLAGFALVAVPTVFPMLVKRLFVTSPLPPATADWIADLMRHSGVGATRVVRWNTGGRTFNAMVAGFVRPLRTLLVTDRLMDELTRPQIAMVVLHEAAHLRRRHMPLRMLSVVPAWIAAGLVTQIAGENVYASTLGTVAGVLLTTLLLRVIALRTEFDADDTACRIAAEIGGRVANVPATYADAARTLGDALDRVAGTQPAARKSSWMHPSVDQRQANLGVGVAAIETATADQACV